MAISIAAATALLSGCGGSSTSPSGVAQLPRWSAPATVARFNDFAAQPAVAAAGTVAYIAWSVPGIVRASRLGDDGRWGAPESVGPGLAQTPVIGVDAAGRAVAAWSGGDPDADVQRFCVWGSTKAAGTAWTPLPLTCDDRNTSHFPIDLAMGPDGEAVVAWTRHISSFPVTGDTLFSARYSTATNWHDLHAHVSDARVSPSFGVAVDARGESAVTWDEGPVPDDTRSILLATARPAEAWSTAVVRDRFPGQRDPRVAYETPGVPVVAWIGGIGSGMRALRVTSPPYFPASLTENPLDSCVDIAGSGTGSSVITWSRSRQDAGVYAAFGGGGRWEPERIRISVVPPETCPAVAMDEVGNVAVAWQERPTGPTSEIWATVRTASTSSWTPPQLLVTGGTNPSLAMSNGVAHVAWRSAERLAIEESRVSMR